MIRFREADETDVAAVVALLADDVLGQGREGADPALYEAAFARMRDEGANHLIVGEDDAGRIVATYQITFITGLSLRAARRAQVESVRVAGHVRGQGVGEAMFEDAKARASAAGCTLVQLTMNAGRKDASRFYERIGFVASHTGFKMALD
ncbi:aminoalkylphosphonic acid N-acetyltransferase [Roseovarius sp. THAF27]|uniref:GNAT family N-acetyltransferase n=1 Tax=Roseovarius sp. THAF27 TaxID=2587850 RepID=UPI001267B191|nr:GNAT family N-acetyltransferase [Roseovarius sp. THAF27]QFT79638.1 aminoalkylphosphonic acid N-acetyltransferase [Roseovarius sp. THAF27]